MMASLVPHGADKNGIFLVVEQSQSFPNCRWRDRVMLSGKGLDEGHKTKLTTAFVNLIPV